MDFMGKYTPNINGHQYILDKIDILTSFLIAVPILDKTANSVATVFMHNIVVYILGIPKMMFSNN